MKKIISKREPKNQKSSVVALELKIHKSFEIVYVRRSRYYNGKFEFEWKIYRDLAPSTLRRIAAMIARRAGEKVGNTEALRQSEDTDGR